MKVLICFEKCLMRLRTEDEVEGEEILVSKLSSVDDFHKTYFFRSKVPPQVSWRCFWRSRLKIEESLIDPYEIAFRCCQSIVITFGNKWKGEKKNCGNTLCLPFVLKTSNTQKTKTEFLSPSWNDRKVKRGSEYSLSFVVINK